jgi:hypothetical protein
MKKILLLIFLAAINCYGLSLEDAEIKAHGETNISSSEGNTFETNLYIEYNLPLYEPDHKKWGLFMAGKVNPAYDHLGNEIKVDVFTVLGIDF